MENKKLSAISLLNIRLLGLVSFINELDRARYKDAFILAKAMEKEQIINAHLEGWGDAYDYLKDEISEARQAEDYYNDIYGEVNI